MVYIETGNASEAYRQAYKSDKMSAETVKVNASQLLKNTNVALTIEKLKNKHAKRHELTIDDLVKELEEARQAALSAETVQSSAAVGATMGKAKLLGLVIEKNEHTGKDGKPIQTEMSINVSFKSAD